MFFRNANLYTPEFTFQFGSFGVEDGQFISVSADNNHKGEDLAGAYVIPGLIDIHCHGNSGVDFSSCKSVEEIEIATRYLAKNGITSLLFTVGSRTVEDIEESFRQARQFMKATPSGVSYLHGVIWKRCFLA